MDAHEVSHPRALPFAKELPYIQMLPARWRRSPRLYCPAQFAVRPSWKGAPTATLVGVIQYLKGGLLLLLPDLELTVKR